MSSEENTSPVNDVAPTMVASIRAGGSIGPYRLQQQLGEGGMGEVWLAEQLRPVRRQVAVKVIKAGMDTAQLVARFEAERQALAMMEHPCVAKILDAGSTPEGRPYFAMEYVRGEPITRYCDRQRLTLRERLNLFIDLCGGVQHAHQKGIIHRDLKPSNILVAVQGEQAVPRIIDFGVAKAVAQPLTERAMFTELGVLIGTPEYMSPEQAEMTSLDVDTRSDLYSLGIILYELLTGTLPFDTQELRSAGLDEIRRTIREKDPPRPSTRVGKLGEISAAVAANRRIEPGRLTSALRGDLDWIILKALEKDRTRRYDTANAFALDLQHHLDNEPVRARPPSTTYKMGKFVRRHRIGVAVAAATVLLLVSVTVVTTLQARRIARERDRADREAAAARQVSDFLTGLFKVSDPSEARGSALTAREILSKGAQNISQTLHNQPDLRARLESIIGDVYMNLGLYGEAEPLLRDALLTQQTTLGHDATETLTTMNRLANLNWFKGRLEEAEPLYREVVEGRRRTFGEEHPDTLRANFDLASLYVLQKRYEEAERLALKTLETQRRVLGSEHPDTMSSLNNLQSLYYKQGRYAQAEPIALETLASRRRQLGDNHPSTINSMHNVATIYAALGRDDKAEPLYRQVIEAKSRVLGEDHPFISDTLRQLSLTYQRQRRFEQAETAALAAYRGYVRAGVQRDRPTAVARQLVDLYKAWGKSKQAADWESKLASGNDTQTVTR